MSIRSWRRDEAIPALLPFSKALQAYHCEANTAGLELLEDPDVTGRSAIIGMFVVRPATTLQPALDDGLLRSVADFSSILDPRHSWVFNIVGHDGGGALSNGNVLDAFRLALQYGLSDAVMVSSKTVAVEGVTSPDGSREGYLWLASAVCSWSHLFQAHPKLLTQIMANRKEWQDRGFISSSRMHPAQIIVTQSGRADYGFDSRDFLDARIFSTLQPTTDGISSGELLEVLILTSVEGAECIRKRVADSPALKAKLEHRLEQMLVVCSPSGQPALLDFAFARVTLYKDCGIKIANHDGGLLSLREFAGNGALTQLNLSMALGKPVSQLPLTSGWSEEDLHQKLELLFSNGGTLPRAFKDNIVAVHTETSGAQAGELAVCVISMRPFEGKDFYDAES